MSASTTNSRQRLATEVQYLKGVGPERAPLLNRIGIKTAMDVLFRFPRTYQDMSMVCPIAELEEGVAVSVRGVVEEIDERATMSGKNIVGVLLKDETGFLRAMWFNQPFVRKRFRRGGTIMLSGAPKRAGLRWEMVHPRIQNIETVSDTDKGEILPVYPLTEGLKQTHMRRIVAGVLADYSANVQEVLPKSLIDENDLWSIHAALANIHFPRSAEALESARRRFVYQELLVLQLALAIRKHQLETSARAEPITVSAQIDARIRRLFEFSLTDGQEVAIEEIVADMSRTIPMNRLLQGDVGSGKTMVAIYAMLVATAQGFQAALMAPTEVLARQHYQTLSKALAQARVHVALWTGQLTAAQRKQTQEQIESGEVNLVVGTQALIHSDCDYKRLGLVVIDEQHKFGVAQRARLRDAAAAPHYLVMTATPIPRTVAMTSFGDLDVSILRDHPPGRQEVKSYLVKESERERWWEFYRKQLRQGRQGFVVAPRLNESESQDVTSVEESFEALCNGELEEFRLQLIHGRMTAEEKQLVMDSFRNGDTQVLVSTTVIEVGVDIPNASVMTIESADRFGLAQLHQLRGRVGRGDFAGYIGVFSEHLEDEVKRERLEAFVSTNDGFELAELDFQLRGPGDLMGTKQHGLPPLRIADLVRDEATLVEARKLARSLVEGEKLADNEYAGLLQQVMVRYGQRFELGDVG